MNHVSKGKEDLEKIFFPLSSKYDDNWIRKNSLGENVLYNLESLCKVMDLNNKMRIMDLGCGKAISAIFLAREFGAEVWAIDPNVPVDENYRRINDMDCEGKVYPLQMNARELPFAAEFFDAIVVVDSYMYFGTDDKFTPYLANFLKPNGTLGMVDICFRKEINTPVEVPDFLKRDYEDMWYYVHSLHWWKRMWEKSGFLQVDVAEIVPQNNFIKQEYVNDFKNSKKTDAIADALSQDEKELINVFRMIGRRTEKLN